MHSRPFRRVRWSGPGLAIALLLAAGVEAQDRSKGELPAETGPLAPAESASKFKVPDDLAIDLLLSEPEIAQPVSVGFDERGRLWVVEYRQYPEVAGLKVLSRDGVWRVVFDKVPPAPPNHVRGRDRISIHEDADGDGKFEKHKIFVDGLNIATAFARGRGGVFVLNPPYLLYYPDKDNDDVPDGDPEVLLEGFGLEDTHSVVNSLRWGPDGWLYAAQGSTVSGKVKRPGSAEPAVHSMGQLIWRYHPETHRYEIFAEGGGNAFGVEIDAKGRIFSGHNGGDTRGFHYVQGSYSRKGFDKHGPLSNPYAFGYFPAMKHPTVPRFTHTFAIDEGGSLPEKYRGKLFGVAPLLNYVVMSEVIPEGSTFRTVDVNQPVTTSDPWFRPVDIEPGPDGALYVADWYDGQTSHIRNQEGRIDRTNGRVYRLRAKDAKPIAPFDLSKLSTAELVEKLRDPNRWTRRTALRLIGDRKDESVAPTLARMAREESGQAALESLWALNLVGGLDHAASMAMLDHADPYVRLWTVRLLADPGHVSPEIASKLALMAKAEPNVEARSQLACSAKRLPADQCLPIVRNLIDHDEDADDPHLPLLIWWAIESKAESDREAVVAMFRDPSIWSRAIVEGTIAERIMRRYASSGSRKDLLTCAELLKLAPGSGDVKRLMDGFEAALAGRSLPSMPDELAEAMARSQAGSVLLGLRRGTPSAIDEALQTLQDQKADPGKKLRYVQVFGEVMTPRALPALLKLATRSADPALQSGALAALARYDDPSIAPAILASLGSMTEDLRLEAFALLASRDRSALGLVKAVEAGTLDPQTVPPEVIRRLRARRDEALAAMVRKHWGDVRPTSSAALQAEIERLAVAVRADPGDPRKGEPIFAKKCAGCHMLFGVGGKVGPDLTTYKRDDLDTMLLSIVNPTAEIREGYASFAVAALDGRTLEGVLVDQDPNVVVLRDSQGRDNSIRREEIEEMVASRTSIMPEGMLKEMTDPEIRDLFAYLRGNQPPK
ncbi:PVC-type heme-binding CxxCH protein [Tundrisphaera lichenicola]|uniref:PVC-type heme-binding CxxCH protein n=1 Tax=Tundrisphaera lichenicola TaxID=2029860 RepID=UPI003EB798E5